MIGVTSINPQKLTINKVTLKSSWSWQEFKKNQFELEKKTNSRIFLGKEDWKSFRVKADETYKIKCKRKSRKLTLCPMVSSHYFCCYC